jgi:hypothetical protein
MRKILFMLLLGTALALFSGTSVNAKATGALDLGLQDVNLSCNDGTDLGLTLDADSVLQLSDAVSAINLYPAGDPALDCSLTQSTAVTRKFASASAAAAANGNGPQDFVVGGGQAPFLNFSGGCASVNFSVSAHAPETATTPPGVGTPTSGGTFNLSNPSSLCTQGNLVAKIDCLQVGVSPGRAQLSAVVKHSTGIYAVSRPEGTEIEVDLFDSGMPGGTGDRLQTFFTAPCAFDGFVASQTITAGNINVHNN